MLDLYEFETTEAAVIDAPGGEPGAAPSPDPAAGEAAPPPAVATETAPGWSPEDPAFRDAVAQEADAILGARIAELQQQQPQTAADPQDAPPDYDPFDPDSIRAYMAWERQQTLQALRSELAPVRETFEEQRHEQQIAHLTGVVDDIIADEFSRNGDLTDPGKELLQPLGVQFLPQFEARYGKGSPRALEATVAHTASLIRSLEKTAADKAVEAHVNRNAQLAGATGEPGVGAGSGVAGRPEGPYRPGELARVFGQNANRIKGGTTV